MSALIFTHNDRIALLALAREAIRTAFEGGEARIPQNQLFRRKRGVFVTLKDNGELRGCCGFPYPSMPLGAAVVEASRCAAFRDPRFSALRRDQVENIDITISLLTEPKLLQTSSSESIISRIRIGADGLLIKQEHHSGLLLPVVATEYNMDSEAFLECLCCKAGLPPGAWSDPSAMVYTFQTDVISTSDVSMTSDPVADASRGAAVS